MHNVALCPWMCPWINRAIYCIGILWKSPKTFRRKVSHLVKYYEVANIMYILYSFVTWQYQVGIAILSPFVTRYYADKYAHLVHGAKI